MKKIELVESEKLPVLEAMIEAFSTKEMPSLQTTVFVCVQHLLFTTVNLLESLVRLGARPNNIHVMGKSYSSCSAVADQLIKKGYNYYPNTHQEKLAKFADCFQQDVKEMWRRVCENLNDKTINLVVVLDDGGVCLMNIPDFIKKKYPLVGVEQTTSGLSSLSMRDLAFPVIEVASSAAKQLVEAPMIAEAVVRKLESILPMDKRSLSCAVVGMGCIGGAITQKLLSLNHSVMIYDTDTEKSQRWPKAVISDDIEALVYEADYIFGCSGKDVTKNLNISAIKKNKTFISCSSQDKEFLTLLQLFEKNGCTYHNVLQHLECHLNNQTVKIFRGGFPINLDNSGESVAAVDIQLTRGLLLGGILQGIAYASESSQRKGRYMLHPAIQNFIVSHWRFHGSTFLFASEFLDMFYNHSWIEKNSTGIYEENVMISKYFNCALPSDIRLTINHG